MRAFPEQWGGNASALGNKPLSLGGECLKMPSSFQIALAKKRVWFFFLFFFLAGSPFGEGLGEYSLYKGEGRGGSWELGEHEGSAEG